MYIVPPEAHEERIKGLIPLMPTVRSPGGLALEEVFHPNRNKHKDIRKERPFLHPSSPKTALPCDLQGWEKGPPGQVT